MAKQILRKRTPVTAIHIDDLERILKRLKLYEPVINGKVKCYFCNETLTLENIGGILSVNGETVLICDKPGCLIKATILSAKTRKLP